MTQQLIRNIILPHFRNDLIEQLHDGATFSLNGKRLAFSTDSYVVLQVMRKHPLGRQATVIGRVVDEHAGMVVMRTTTGSKRVLGLLSGEQLPRVC